MEGLKPTILVTGATGNQGGAVARHLLQRGNFTVRALVRYPNKLAAQALKQAGAELVAGDLNDLGIWCFAKASRSRTFTW